MATDDADAIPDVETPIFGAPIVPFGADVAPQYGVPAAQVGDPAADIAVPDAPVVGDPAADIAVPDAPAVSDAPLDDLPAIGQPGVASMPTLDTTPAWLRTSSLSSSILDGSTAGGTSWLSSSGIGDASWLTSPSVPVRDAGDDEPPPPVVEDRITTLPPPSVEDRLASPREPGAESSDRATLPRSPASSPHAAGRRHETRRRRPPQRAARPVGSGPREARADAKQGRTQVGLATVAGIVGIVLAFTIPFLGLAAGGYAVYTGVTAMDSRRSGVPRIQSVAPTLLGAAVLLISVVRLIVSMID